ncbi:MAG: xanthine dehydrogenase family protein molybdopterin-binding subunit [Halanaerobiales bacterium]|nr:xanthine dehydrogenase family protein molybdopterin-binding subunit [Halanaerobiales bacterium]
MEFAHVNKSEKRVDVYEKVTGKAKYGADMKFPDMLYAEVLHTEYPYAKIVSIDTSKAEKMPGVEAVITAEDIPNNEFGVIIENQQVLAKKKALYIGDGVAIVAARTPKQAKKAVEAIEVEYEELKGVFDPLKSREAGSQLVHDDLENNEVIHHPLRKGDVNEGFKNSDVILEREYSTPFIEQSYIEPEAVIAVPYQENSTVTVYGSVQNPFATQNAVATVLKEDLNKIRIVQNHMGGSFGGKDEVVSSMAARASVLALKTEKPIKMVNTRDQSIRESYKRHPYNMKYKIGANKDGKIQAMEIEAVADSGAYACQTPFVTWRSVVQATGPYEVENVKTDTYGYYTNNVYTGAMRGYGSPQVIFAQESLMDELAEELDMDPIELRMKNIYHNDSVTASGQKLDSHEVSLEEVLTKAVEKSNYVEKYKKYSKEQTGSKKRGIGFAISFRGCSLGAEAIDAAGIILSLKKDGSVSLYSGLAENGQGLKTVYCQMAAEKLGIETNKVNFMQIDTLISPDSGSTVASRATLIGGNAVMKAAENLIDKIKEYIAEKFEQKKEDIKLKNGSIYGKKDVEIMTLKEMASKAAMEGIYLTTYGWYVSPDISWDEETGHGNPYFTYVYGCQVAEVEVDTYTGEIDVINMTAAHDVGRAINPANVKGQIFGGVSMGLGYGIMEEVETDQGYIKSTNFDEYLIPTVKDMPDIDPIIVENPDPNGPFGAKSIGEPTLELGAAAISNAVANATKKRIRSLPLKLEKIIVGKDLTKGGEK